MANFKIIKYLCKERGMSLSQLADAIGSSLGSVQKIIRENSTKVETLEKICVVLNVKADILLNDLHANLMRQNANLMTQNANLMTQNGNLMTQNGNM